MVYAKYVIWICFLETPCAFLIENIMERVTFYCLKKLFFQYMCNKLLTCTWVSLTRAIR